MSQKLEVEIDIRIKVSLERVPGFGEIAQNITLDKEQWPDAMFQIKRIDANYEWKKEEEP